MASVSECVAWHGMAHIYSIAHGCLLVCPEARDATLCYATLCVAWITAILRSRFCFRPL